MADIKWHVVWRGVSDSEAYEISNNGRLRRRKRDGGFKEVDGWVSNMGYREFTYYSGDKMIQKGAHRLVAEAFVPVPPDLSGEKRLDVHHIDGDKLNNRFKNLTWLRRSDHIALDQKNGGPLAKVTPEAVHEMLERYESLVEELAEKYGVSDSQVKGIMTNRVRNWAKVAGDFYYKRTCEKAAKLQTEDDPDEEEFDLSFLDP